MKTTIRPRGGRGAKPRKSAAARVQFGPLGNWVGFNLRMAQEASFQAFSRRSHEVGEHPGRFAILTLIAENPGINQTALGAAAGRDKSSMTPVLEDLVRRSLVQRYKNDRDRRTYRVSITAAGARTLAKLKVCALAHEEQLDRVVGPRERTRFIRTLKRIAAALD